LPISLLEKWLLIGVVALVLIVELINSAIEAAIDRISLERHPLAKQAKDYGSAAVLLTLFLAIGTWASLLLSRF
jgi:diacylglycerol kinase (ATP)